MRLDKQTWFSYLLASLLLTTPTALAAQPGDAPSLTVTPSPCDLTFWAEPANLIPGRPVALMGQGFTPHEPIDLHLKTPPSASGLPAGWIDLPAQGADESGNIALAYQTEAGDPPGQYIFRLVGRESGCPVEGGFGLQSTAAPTSEQATPSPVPPTKTPTRPVTPTPPATPAPTILLIGVDPLLRHIPHQPWGATHPTPSPTPTGTPALILPGQGGR